MTQANRRAMRESRSVSQLSVGWPRGWSPLDAHAVASPFEGRGGGFSARQLELGVAKPLTLVLTPCLRGEARKADVLDSFLKTHNPTNTTLE